MAKAKAAAKPTVMMRLDRILYPKIDPTGAILEFTEVQDDEEIRGVEVWVSAGTARRHKVGQTYEFGQEDSGQ